MKTLLMVALLAMAAQAAPPPAPVSPAQLSRLNVQTSVQDTLRSDAKDLPLIRTVGDIPVAVREAIAYDTGPMVDPDQPMAIGAVGVTVRRPRTSRLIWMARYDYDLYLVHWERPLQDGVVRELTLVQLGRAGMAYPVWEARYLCEPFDESLRRPDGCPASTKLDDLGAFRAALARPGFLIGSPLAPPTMAGFNARYSDDGLPHVARAALEGARNVRLETDPGSIPTAILDLLRPTVTTRTDLPLRDWFAAPGAPFTSTDMIILGPNGRAPPSARLLWGARVGDYYLLHWEDGGMGGPFGPLNLYRFAPDGSARLVWYGSRPAAIMDPRRRMPTFEGFQAALNNGEISSNAAAPRCLHPLQVPPRVVKALRGDATTTRVTTVAGLPPAVVAVLPERTNPAQMREASFELPRSTPGTPAISKLLWAERLGSFWFVQQAYAPQVDAALLQRSPASAEVRYALTIIEDTAAGPRRVIETNYGPYPGLAPYRAAITGLVTDSFAEALDANQCPDSGPGLSAPPSVAPRLTASVTRQPAVERKFEPARINEDPAARLSRAVRAARGTIKGSYWNNPELVNEPMVHIEAELVDRNGQVAGIRRAFPIVVGDLSAPNRNVAIYFEARRQGDGLVVTPSLVVSDSVFLVEPLEVPNGQAVNYDLGNGLQLTMAVLLRGQTPAETAASNAFLDYDRDRLDKVTRREPAPTPRSASYPTPPPMDSVINLRPPAALAQPSSSSGPRAPLRALASEDIQVPDVRPARGPGLLSQFTQRVNARQLTPWLASGWPNPPGPDDPFLQVQGEVILKDGRRLEIRNTILRSGQTNYSLEALHAIDLRFTRAGTSLRVAASALLDGHAYVLEAFTMPSGTTVVKDLPNGEVLILSAVVRPQSEAERERTIAYNAFRVEDAAARARGEQARGFSFPSPPPIERFLTGTAPIPVSAATSPNRNIR